VDNILKNSIENIKQIAKEVKSAKNFFFIGRGISFSVAMEGALKLKEISYIHAEAYASGELKHGPLALLEKDVPVVAIMPKGVAFSKCYSNVEECKAREATIIAISEDDKKIHKIADYFIPIPKGIPEMLSTLPYILPLHLLSYFIADELNCPIDQPRNLAKSVTVE
jgi:glucosamine--fructose-6-phosphate aminotransferase (isomerizing)